MEVNEVLASRASSHGEFADNARIMQKLKDAIRAEPGYSKLDPTKREALDMILHKVGRICSGNPEEPDHWLDIEGYARLARDRVKLPPASPTSGPMFNEEYKRMQRAR